MVDSNGGSTSDVKEFYEDEKQLMKLCDFLRSSEGPPVREAIEMDKRVYYIKGEYLFVGYIVMSDGCLHYRDDIHNAVLVYGQYIPVLSIYHTYII